MVSIEAQYQNAGKGAAERYAAPDATRALSGGLAQGLSRQVSQVSLAVRLLGEGLAFPVWQIRYNIRMSVKEIEAAITQLPVRDVTELMSWLAEHHAEVWDKQIEYDLDSGKLDALLAEVDKEYEAGLAKPL